MSHTREMTRSPPSFLTVHSTSPKAEVRRWILKTGTVSTPEMSALHPPQSGDNLWNRSYIINSRHLCHSAPLVRAPLAGNKVSFSKVYRPLYSLGTLERGREILTPPFPRMGFSHLASILKQTGSLKAKEDEALSRLEHPRPLS